MPARVHKHGYPLATTLSFWASSVSDLGNHSDLSYLVVQYDKCSLAVVMSHYLCSLNPINLVVMMQHPSVNCGDDVLLAVGIRASRFTVVRTEPRIWMPTLLAPQVPESAVFVLGQFQLFLIN